MLISVEGTGKNHLEPSEVSGGDASVLSHCSLLRNPLPKPTGVLEHCCERETNCWCLIFRGVSLRPHYFIRSSNYCKLYQRIPGTFLATTYNCHLNVLNLQPATSGGNPSQWFHTEKD